MDEPATRTGDGEQRSRRAFLGGTALVGGTLALSGIGSAANDSSDDANTTPSDVEILNYALTLEHLEYAFYEEFLANHTESEVENSAVAQYFARPTLRYSTYQQIEDVRDHEGAHVEALTETIEKLGGTPVEPAAYEFPYETMEEFVAIADRLEAVGVSAYAGAAPMIDDEDVLKAALSIHSVEAEHQTYFQLLNLQRPSPDAFNTARSMDQVLPIAKQFVVGTGGGGDDGGDGGDDGTDSAGQLSVVALQADAGGDDAANLNDEFVTYGNTGDAPLDLSGWTVTDADGTTYTFPDGVTLEPGAELTLYTGSGSDTDTEFYWGQENEVWENGADTMTVRNASGEVVLQRSYP
ncbi:ferritin-like domain-containing protein [Halococcus agarilyticus]|uniref:ferritin-like domain-containing protein n=1 Tax=Halococcus agarilyticus TaxID=1232219 RepID=UPI000678001E|nr:ferritin-like domain-containing protein [Halococcus agarilyticus]